MPARVRRRGEGNEPDTMKYTTKSRRCSYSITVKDDRSFHVETAVGNKFVAHTLVVANRMALSYVAGMRRNKRMLIKDDPAK
jgi:hypothetical protein